MNGWTCSASQKEGRSRVACPPHFAWSLLESPRIEGARSNYAWIGLRWSGADLGPAGFRSLGSAEVNNRASGGEMGNILNALHGAILKASTSSGGIEFLEVHPAKITSRMKSGGPPAGLTSCAK